MQYLAFGWCRVLMVSAILVMLTLQQHDVCAWNACHLDQPSILTVSASPHLVLLLELKTWLYGSSQLHILGASTEAPLY